MGRLCGMLYNTIMKGEAAAHTRYCHKTRNPVDYKGCKTETVVWCNSVVTEERIISVLFDNASPYLLAKVREVKKIADSEMGFYNGSEDKKKRCAYMYINKNVITALLVVEPVDNAYSLVITDKEGGKISVTLSSKINLYIVCLTIVFL